MIDRATAQTIVDLQKRILALERHVDGIPVRSGGGAGGGGGASISKAATKAALPTSRTAPALGYTTDVARRYYGKRLADSDWHIFASAISDLEDVDNTGLADGDSLIFDTSTSKWLPGQASVVYAATDKTALDLLSAPNGSLGITTGGTKRTYVRNNSTWIAISHLES